MFNHGTFVPGRCSDKCSDATAHRPMGSVQTSVHMRQTRARRFHPGWPNLSYQEPQGPVAQEPLPFESLELGDQLLSKPGKADIQRLNKPGRADMLPQPSTGRLIGERPYVVRGPH